MINETLWEETDVASATIRNTENRSLSRYGHISQMTEGSVAMFPPQGERKWRRLQGAQSFQKMLLSISF
jgi:hypothetical protein